ncbi:hypothetical protein [Actinokineospora xionganensis]|uniref:Uncharacterized protein n=1 Tax=Actinokineospora xionganensis TaxID=2684470 RepID=A0ABR7LC94_9PSEU|nr:hypothetical protein [Actinokineospora xionganensis]MBC6449917.1 hypothetical protein [Actinokineospora xionganensis]
MKDAGGRLSQDEFDLFNKLLHRYCESELDQWDLCIVDTTYGEVFLTLTRHLLPDHPHEAYTRLPRPE